MIKRKLSWEYISSSYWIQTSVLFVVYALTAKFGLTLNAISGFATLVWAPTGISLAALILFGFRLWPGIACGALLANFWMGAPLVVAIGIGVGNTFEALIGAYLFKRAVGSETSLDKVRYVLALVIFGSFVSTFVSATVGVGCLYIGGVVPLESFMPMWRAWWLGNAISVLVITPVILVWSRIPRVQFTKARFFEGIALSFSVILLGLLIFGPVLNPEIRQYALPYLMFSLLIWATLRFGQHANTLFVVVVTIIAIWGTTVGLGPFNTPNLSNNLLLLQMFMSALALTGLFFGALGREKAEALRLRTDFISIASHELKTPITSLKLQIQVLKYVLNSDQQSLDREKISKILSTSDKQLERLVNMIDSLFDLTQFESGKMIMQREEMDLSTLATDVLNTLNIYFKEAGCLLETQIEPSIKGRWNRERIEQVITNLLMNAVKYGQGKPVKVSLTKEGNEAVLTVQDHGLGIDKKDHDRIFERFERGHLNQKIKGLGLGLFISKQIVETHHGKMLVESEPGKGSQFLVRLPIN